VAEGLKVTLTVQLAPAARVLPQVLVLEKSPAFAPNIATCHKFIVPPPLFVKVTTCAALVVPTVWLANVRLVGDRPPAVPTPVKIIAAAFPELKAIDAFRGPAPVGLKVIFSGQFAPGPREAGQL
jgi:hypothetical protein